MRAIDRWARPAVEGAEGGHRALGFECRWRAAMCWQLAPRLYHDDHGRRPYPTWLPQRRRGWPKSSAWVVQRVALVQRAEQVWVPAKMWRARAQESALVMAGPVSRQQVSRASPRQAPEQAWARAQPRAQHGRWQREQAQAQKQLQVRAPRAPQAPARVQERQPQAQARRQQVQ